MPKFLTLPMLSLLRSEGNKEREIVKEKLNTSWLLNFYSFDYGPNWFLASDVRFYYYWYVHRKYSTMQNCKKLRKMYRAHQRFVPSKGIVLVTIQYVERSHQKNKKKRGTLHYTQGNYSNSSSKTLKLNNI